jgi:hypothetical protein
MTPRDHVHPAALACLDEAWDAATSSGMAWAGQGEPLLAPRTEAVLRAVEDMHFDTCIGFHDSENFLPKPLCQEHGPCKVKEICRAWLGKEGITPTEPRTCGTCGHQQEHRWCHYSPGASPDDEEPYYDDCYTPREGRRET